MTQGGSLYVWSNSSGKGHHLVRDNSTFTGLGKQATALSKTARKPKKCLVMDGMLRRRTPTKFLGAAQPAALQFLPERSPEPVQQSLHPRLSELSLQVCTGIMGPEHQSDHGT